MYKVLFLALYTYIKNNSLSPLNFFSGKKEISIVNKHTGQVYKLVFKYTSTVIAEKQQKTATFYFNEADGKMNN